ncbi:MAG: pyridoxal phosphate-dependent aminotransferase [Pseudomonadota bacterium]|nr:pyridoxal phosphate-dependent aminotransferase [Pseudomonadota bacterium]
MTLISDRLSRFKPSLTVKISQKAREMSELGERVISLSSGEPDFDTPSHIKASAIEAIKDGFTKYTQVDGIPDLKKAIVKKFFNENNLKYNFDQITVGVGGKHVIYNLFMATLNQGDEVIIPSPYWVSYPDMVSLAEGVPIIVETKMDQNFKIKPDQLEKRITKKTKWFIINSPGNPTGAVYNEDELFKISEILMKNPQVNVLSDDIYEHIIYKESFSNILNVEPKLYDRTFIVNGVSKVFSMTGWRIGYGAGDKDIVKSISKIQSQSTTNPCSISQVAAKFALTSEKEFLGEWLKRFEHRRNFLIQFFNSISGLEPFTPSGAFYLYVSCKGFINKKLENGRKIRDDIDFAEYLLMNAKVAVVPGEAFGKSPFFRISYATSLNDLKEACERISNSLKKIT